ncbi:MULTISPECIES: IclR family transcriptional regulator [Chelativorans]|jgi:IclR family acetate operon transcriptional repressor|uniref:Transcriptional regulator, IclR family n=1 Tax=Chelativorans sp. (strain BNC1) TaxID=266779 RepID=Q11AL9_CHESB|nr:MULTISPECIES: IclR family transcriptional regulator [Chelativorans]
MKTGQSRPGRKPTRESVPLTRALDRGLSILELLAKSPGSSLSDISRDLALSPSTVSRLLNTLCERGFVAQSPETKTFRMGPQAFHVGMVFARQNRLDQIASPILRTFARGIGDTISLCIRDGSDVIYIDQYEGGGTARAVIQIGSRHPLHCTAAGKAMLAWLWDERIRELLGPNELPAMTSKTIRRVDDLLRDLETVRRNGYATDLEELEDGVCCVASPIRSSAGEIVGAVSLSTVAPRLDPDRIKAVGAELLRVTNEISRLIGWIPNGNDRAAPASWDIFYD